MATPLRFSINRGLRISIAGGLSYVVSLVFKALQTQNGDQIITQSGDTLGGNV